VPGPVLRKNLVHGSCLTHSRLLLRGDGSQTLLLGCTFLVGTILV
jgi:hypothetical protein